jgi:hypothetical protein
MAGAEAPDINTGWQRQLTIDGTAVGQYLTDWNPEMENNTTDFQGSAGAAAARPVVGRTHSLTFTIANVPAVMSLIEPKAYVDPPLPTAVLVVTDYPGRELTYTVRFLHPTYNGGSGDALTVDVECEVLSVTGIPGVT